MNGVNKCQLTDNPNQTQNSKGQRAGGPIMGCPVHAAHFAA